MNWTEAEKFVAIAQRMQMMMNWLSTSLRIGNNNIQEIEQTFLRLARGIDILTANGEICQWKGDSLILPLIMVLMVSMKWRLVASWRSVLEVHMLLVLLTPNEMYIEMTEASEEQEPLACNSAENACKMGWFSEMETQEIIDLYKELSSSFCLPENIENVLSPSNVHIQTVMERFYPQLRLGSIIACLEVKRLFVAQTDNTEISSCLMGPQQVNFLLNGEGVMGRVNCASMDTGPQIPTNITALLKFGTNILQAVGYFSGNYVIAITVMGVMSLSTSDLKDYVQPGVTTQSSDLDSDVIVGSSHVSLSCPISCERIKVPVKGQSCKHIQCFDFDNFVEINSRRPSWRCPHCNQCISFLDIRRDQNMAKILNEVEDNVQDVIILPDGSWNNTLKSDGHSVVPVDVDVNHQQSPDLRGMNSSSGAISETLEPTMEGDMMDMVQVSDTEDRKLAYVEFLNSMGSDVTMQTECSPSNQANKSTVSQTDDFRLGLDLQNLEPSDEKFDSQSVTNSIFSSDRSTIFASASNTNQQPGYNNHLSSHGGVAMPGQQSSVMNNQYVRVSSVPAIINRTPTAAQSLAPSGTPNAMSSLSQALPSMTDRADRSTTNYAGVEERMQGHSHSALNHTQRPEMPQFISQQHSMRSNPDAMLFQNSGGFNSNILRHQQQQQHQMQMPQQYLDCPVQATGMMQTPQLSQTSAQVGVNNSSTRHIMTTLPTSSAYQNQTFRSGQSSPSNVGAPMMSVQQPQPLAVQHEQLVNTPADSNLRPAGRMRGSLSGRAYEDALNQFLHSTVQQTRPPRPPQDLTSPPLGVPPELHEMITNLSVPPSSSPSA